MASRAENVTVFPGVAPGAPTVDASIRCATTLGRLRRCARRSHLAPRLDLESLCARRAEAPDDGDFWGVALIQTAARDRPLVFHAAAADRPSGAECWLGRLVEAVRAGDEDSARFICERHLDRRARRLALTFAQRLAEAIAREGETRAA